MNDKFIVELRSVQVVEGTLLARSQARRVAHRFERFEHMELDFTDIEQIGQAFADEMFRVFVTAHPDIRITPVNTLPAVAQMIRRVSGVVGTT